MKQEHPELLDGIYRFTRHLYDISRKYYLFGRDEVIEELTEQAPAQIVEIGCGTGRNLSLLKKAGFEGELFGVDASKEMLKTASAQIGSDAKLAFGMAESVELSELFHGREEFETFLFSYSLSMIPDWKGAILRAEEQLPPGGRIFIVDFWNFEGYSAPFRLLMRWWLKKFHVSPRLELTQFLESRKKLIARRRLVGKGYAIIIEAQKEALLDSQALYSSSSSQKRALAP